MTKPKRRDPHVGIVSLSDGQLAKCMEIPNRSIGFLHAAEYGAVQGAQNMLNRVCRYMNHRGFSNEDAERLRDHFTPIIPEPASKPLTPRDQLLCELTELERDCMLRCDNKTQNLARRLYKYIHATPEAEQTSEERSDHLNPNLFVVDTVFRRRDNTHVVKHCHAKVKGDVAMIDHSSYVGGIWYYGSTLPENPDHDLIEAYLFSDGRSNLINP